MAFDIGAGLSSAGTAVAATAGAMTLESQKAELEMEKVKLADQLAGAREEKQRGFLTSERVATQEFTGGENTKNRQNSLDIAKMTTDATIKSAGIGAGATIASAQMHVAMMQKQMDQNAPLIAAQIKQVGASTEQEIAKTALQVITNSNAREKEAAQQELAEAGKSNDPDRIAKAQQRFAVASASTSEASALATSTASLAKLAKDELDKVQAQMALPMNQVPERQAQLQTQVKAAEDLWKQRMAAAIRASESVPPLPTAPAAGGGGLIKYDAQGRQVTGAAPGAPPVTGAPAAAAPTSLPMPSQGFLQQGPM